MVFGYYKKNSSFSFPFSRIGMPHVSDLLLWQPGIIFPLEELYGIYSQEA
jgi:hypothetical protein